MKNVISIFVWVPLIVNTICTQPIPDSLDFSIRHNEHEEQRRFTQTLQFGNIHGLGVEFEYKLTKRLSINSSIGVNMPISIVIGPPFSRNRFNITSQFKIKPIKWIYISIGGYLGFYELTKYTSISTTKASIGLEFKKSTLEIGALFNTPKKIYTKTVTNYGSYGLSEERIRPVGPTFPFFKFSYRLPKRNA